MKKCSKCGESKPLKEFYLSKKSTDKRYSSCKDCKNRIREEHLETPKGRYSTLKRGARDRGFTFTITFEQFLKFWNVHCHYCGDKIDGVGLDRIDNSRGYEPDNIVPCCKTCNYMKWVFTTDKFINHCRKIVKFQNNR